PEDWPIPEKGPLGELFRRFFEQGEELVPEETESLGSGFIISPDGFIITNHHVVSGADEIIVRLNNRKSYEARFVGSDEASDIALLKIEARDLPSVKIGDSRKLKIGAWVLAIGSPFGFDSTVTAGIVSAKGRSLPADNYVPYIQTDVAINPGNSGGPLFNLDGEVIGVNSQIFSRSGGFMGLSFAVPIELAINVVQQIKEKGRVSRGYLGVLIQDVDRNLAQSFGLDYPRGALVSKVIAGSPADHAGLRVGDIILSFNDTPIQDSSQLPPQVGASLVGQTARMEVLRNGQVQAINVKIMELPSEEAGVAQVREEQDDASRGDRLGLVVGEPTREERKALQLPDKTGVVVKSVTKGAAA
ncbi:MAG TPA: Do family serine endopeptidase, partial [Chromatiaceae bacterium]|nr:Do family serine endopeptidase [Chromatiaceae bacterium]